MWTESWEGRDFLLRKKEEKNNNKFGYFIYDSHANYLTDITLTHVQLAQG